MFIFSGSSTSSICDHLNLLEVKQLLTISYQQPCSAGLGPTTGGRRSQKSFRRSVMDWRNSTKPNSCLWRSPTNSTSFTPRPWRMLTLTTSPWSYWWDSTLLARQASYGEKTTHTAMMHTYCWRALYEKGGPIQTHEAEASRKIERERLTHPNWLFPLSASVVKQLFKQ